MEPVTSITELLSRAKQAEVENNSEQAIKLYELVIKSDPLQADAYTRLMILYRKEKDYTNEIRTIDKGIKAFSKQTEQRTKKSRIKKVAAISLAFMKSTGLSDKKGNPVYEPEPIATWKKRRQVVEKKLGRVIKMKKK